jgi:hypothetical protein
MTSASPPRYLILRIITHTFSFEPEAKRTKRLQDLRGHIAVWLFAMTQQLLITLSLWSPLLASSRRGSLNDRTEEIRNIDIVAVGTDHVGDPLVRFDHS